MFWFYNWLIRRFPLILNCLAQCRINTIVENHPENKSEIKRKKEISAGDQATKSTTNTNPDALRCSNYTVFTKALLTESCVELLINSSIWVTYQVCCPDFCELGHSAFFNGINV